MGMDNISIDLPKNFLNEENRNGFFIDEHTKRIWAVQIDLLSKIIDVSKSNNIKFTVCFGTLLGVIRHRGYIPWDWDIDVYLVRDEYEKLIKILSEDVETPYFLQNAHTDKRFFSTHSVFRNSESTCIVPWRKSRDYNSGIGIDIFPLDGFTDDKRKRKKQLRSIRFKSILLRSYYSEKGDLKGLREVLNQLLKMVLPRFVPYENLLNSFEKEAKRYNIDSTKVTWFNNFPMHELERYSIEKKDLLSIKWMPFEFIEVPVPENYETMLKKLYGNYMELPSMEEINKQKSTLIMDADIPYIEYFKREAIINE